MSERTIDRLEKALESFAYIVLWDLTLAVLITYVQLMLFKKADMLVPFKTLIVLGFTFWAFYSIFGVYLHIIEKKFQTPISLCVKIMSSFASIATTIYAIPSTFTVEAWLTLNISYNPSILLVFVVGVFSALIGLFFVTYRAGEIKRKKRLTKATKKG